MDMPEHVLEAAIIAELRHHLAGWRAKISNDFSKENYDRELELLVSDPLYPKFGLDTPDYVNIRFMGRVSISIGRRLGEIYDKIPRRLAIEKYGLTAQQVSPKLGNLELDVGLRFSELSVADAAFVSNICIRYLNEIIQADGIGIEIRYNFNPNDSSRLRKDEDMANRLISANLRPVYLVFSSISPRQEAISRLERAGWKFLVGQKALDFATEIFGLDLAGIWDRPAIKAEIKREMDGMMSDIKSSHSFSQF
ncbi:hypothetical protein [Psychrobacter aquimaris]|uniref:hypothetical protein n=1 Tax=Psychrobacter aquimaris TaxID=292733 RepID=UPI003FD43D39